LPAAGSACHPADPRLLRRRGAGKLHVSFPAGTFLENIGRAGRCLRRMGRKILSRVPAAGSLTQAAGEQVTAIPTRQSDCRQRSSEAGDYASRPATLSCHSCGQAFADRQWNARAMSPNVLISHGSTGLAAIRSGGSTCEADELANTSRRAVRDPRVLPSGTRRR